MCEPKTLEWINNSKKFNEFLNPEHFPMIVQPTDWTNPFNGGYRNTKGIYLVKGHRITSHMNYLEELKQYDMPEVYNSINDLQKTRWKVNRNILLVLNTCYNYGNRSRGKLINNELLDLPPKPHDIATNKVSLKKWKAKAVAVYTAKERTKSNITRVKFMSPSNKLKLADEGDTKKLVKLKGNDAKTYKLTKSLGIKYCQEMIKPFENWKIVFNQHKKKDDLADSFLQGMYYFNEML